MNLIFVNEYLNHIVDDNNTAQCDVIIFIRQYTKYHEKGLRIESLYIKNIKW